MADKEGLTPEVLSEIMCGWVAAGQHLDEVAAAMARVLPMYVAGELKDRYFPFWETTLSRTPGLPAEPHEGAPGALRDRRAPGSRKPSAWLGLDRQRGLLHGGVLLGTFGLQPRVPPARRRSRGCAR